MKLFQFMSLYITRRCNLACHYCGVRSNKVPEMRIEEWKKALDIITPHTAFYNIIGGEPTLYPGIEDIIHYMEDIDAVYSLVTNSTSKREVYKKLVNKGLSSISLSMDYHNTKNKKRSSDIVKSEAAKDLVLYLRQTLKYKGEIVLVSVLRDCVVEEMYDVLNFAEGFNCKWVFCVMQSYNQESRGLSNPSGNIPEMEVVGNKTKDFILYLIENYPSIKTTFADPLEYLKFAIDRANDKKLWKCKTGTNPAIDADGKIWACMDYIGKTGININDPFFNIDSMINNIREEVKNCNGCVWNCTYIAEQVYLGNIVNPFV